ncbi:tryptophan halogenase family protein [Paremcibacter congregatus]|uniref:Tryptophan halogenase n=1 Tax=Paremcibacter congregatus TaxID=2043170 RepID=A0A2G4YSY8_9PROT|nr:tryptophan halogenase family protein [Paremcibacter congregatus]PHZ85413.1 tryptophan halogenase [Paremcibacter congregatus]QDE27943.1 tryptophan 7-halogenase [Paremcibacter congregatus]
MTAEPIQKLVIVGGGTAGWMSASLLVKLMGADLDITLVESDEIGTVGVGEATIPPIQTFNNVLGLDENAFLRQTQGTFKLGIQFENWGAPGDKYMHAFGPIGRELGFSAFHHFWLRRAKQGASDSLWDYSLNYQAAKADKFARLDHLPGSSLPGLTHAFHFDAGLYARYLRAGSEQMGVRRVEGRITQTQLNSETGFIEAVILEDGTRLEGDLFLDCSGFRSLLMGEALQVGYEDWTHWLPCDRAIAVPAENGPRLRPYTQSIAHQAGWQWRIPLQNRAGNGHVYCSDHISEDEATAVLMNNLEGMPLAEPRTLRFTTGRRAKFWHKNCIAVGLSSGFMEPLESTSIHLIQTAVVRLAQMFPTKAFDAVNEGEYNRQLGFEYERIRDFIILHYHTNQRTDSPFWTTCREMAIPESLQHKMDLFTATGRIFRENNELFTEDGWLQVMIGQGLRPASYHPLADQVPMDTLTDFMANLRGLHQRALTDLPSHTAFIAAHCAAGQVREI